ncbi:MAG: glycoside hydrolase family 43 protein [Bacteroidales bacterium]|nr:glycoside hydrolase family 43 protein [Bacteroidales bacterium]
MKAQNLLLSVMALAAVGCAPKDPIPAAPQGEALFDNFSYIGDDDFYKRNPLPNETSYYNPILPGFYPDPTIVTNGKGDYYLATSTFTYLPGVPLFHSKDLVNWKQVGHILDRENQVANCEGHDVSRGIFAPALAYNPATETYYMITTNVNAGTGNFYVKTQDPAGSWSDPIYLPSIQGIDPSIFIDDDGKAYIINNDDAPDNKPEYPGHRTVRIQELDLATDQCVGERKIIINKGWNPAEKPVWCEAPHIYKINGYYYLMTAEGGTSTWHSEVMYRSKSVWGPYEPCKRNPFLTQRTLDPNRPDPVTCAGHADLVKTPEGDWWAVFLACRPVEEEYENLGREVFLLPLTWDEEGWPVMTGQDKVIDQVVENGPAKRGDNVTFGNFSREDNFDNAELGMEWVTLRTKIEGQYSFTQYPGWLSLKENEVTAREKGAPSMILHRLHHHNFAASTHMRYQPVEAEDAAGMVLYKDQDHFLFMALTTEEGKPVVQLQEVYAKKQPEYPGPHDLSREELLKDVKVLASVPCADTKLEMQVTSDGKTFNFAFRAEGAAQWTTLGEGVAAHKYSTRDTGGFCGTMVGLYCTGK